MSVDHTRGEDGKLPCIAFPGGYSILYLMQDGETICGNCANGENDSEARTTQDDAKYPSDGWFIVAAYIHWEGPNGLCAHCNKELPSEYGDPDNKPEEE